MKYEVYKDEEGHVILQLGTSKNVSFAPECTPEEVVLGVTELIERVVGISTFDLVTEVVAALDG